jgi:hypothetical protein
MNDSTNSICSMLNSDGDFTIKTYPALTRQGWIAISIKNSRDRYPIVKLCNNSTSDNNAIEKALNERFDRDHMDQKLFNIYYQILIGTKLGTVESKKILTRENNEEFMKATLTAKTQFYLCCAIQ